jgi:biopolymer transport protein ExbB/TolQ
MSTAPFQGAGQKSLTQWMAAVAPFAIGIPLAAGFLALVHIGPLQDTPLERYLHHPVEMVEVMMFACAMTALALKLVGAIRQRAALKAAVLEPWDGTTVPPSQAPALRAALEHTAGRWRQTVLVRRIDAALDFVGCRGSADSLDDHLRALADTDAIAQENGFALIRFITWAIPILGFLGTVLGITAAIANVTPEVLEKSISSVTDGLAVAFDATAVALALTMVTMFFTLLTERMEQGVLEAVDHYADVNLAHRFERGGREQGESTAALKHHTAVMVQATEQLVRQQAAIWSQALTAAQQKWNDAAAKQEAVLGHALEKALDKTLAAHQGRLAAVERQVEEKGGALLGQLASLSEVLRATSREQQASAAKTLEAVTAQTAALARLQEDGKVLVRLQEVLHQNLAALHGAGAFEQAVQSLTAAIHLLTAKAGPMPTSVTASRVAARSGSAA